MGFSLTKFVILFAGTFGCLQGQAEVGERTLSDIKKELINWAPDSKGTTELGQSCDVNVLDLKEFFEIGVFSRNQDGELVSGAFILPVSEDKNLEVREVLSSSGYAGLNSYYVETSRKSERDVFIARKVGHNTLTKRDIVAIKVLNIKFGQNKTDNLGLVQSSVDCLLNAPTSK